MRAALLCAALAVVLQSMVNLAFDITAWRLHVIVFGAVLLPAIYGLGRMRQAQKRSQASHWDWSDRTIIKRAPGAVAGDAYRLVRVANFGLALVVTLQPVVNSCVRSDSNPLTELTIWKWGVDPVLYRKISLLAYWHARGAHE